MNSFQQLCEKSEQIHKKIFVVACMLSKFKVWNTKDAIETLQKDFTKLNLKIALDEVAIYLDNYYEQKKCKNIDIHDHFYEESKKSLKNTFVIIAYIENDLKKYHYESLIIGLDNLRRFLIMFVESIVCMLKNIHDPLPIKIQDRAWKMVKMNLMLNTNRFEPRLLVEYANELHLLNEQKIMDYEFEEKIIECTNQARQINVLIFE